MNEDMHGAGRWLAFDGSWRASVGWYEDPAEPVLGDRGLGATAEWMYGSGDGMASMRRTPRVSTRCW
ncbi:hypothetical protein [Streptomyces sp. NPDC057686]|uniref:hypothetical protein n=1 Tax=Streptomyces sp. NPDC057686 TaxID=3346212 RepID=UPI0036868169